MKSLPKSICILGEIYKVKLKKNLMLDGKPAGGLCDFYDKVIYLDPEPPDIIKLQTLIHECCHVYLEITGLTQYMNEREIESFCQLNSYFIMQFTRSFKK